MTEFSITSEKFIIGCLVKDYPHTRRMALDTGLESKHLEHSTSKTIWEMAEVLFAKGHEVDAASIIEGIERDGRHIDTEAASATVFASMTIATTPKNLPLHIATVMEKHTKRMAKELLHDAVLAIDSGDELESTLASVKHSLAKFGRSKRNMLSKKERLKLMVHRYCNIRHKGCSGIESRWNQIQSNTAGYPFGKITVLGARPKMGKSTLALNEAVYTALVNKVPTAFFSLEMDEDELLEKAGADITETDNMRLKLGQMSAEEIETFVMEGPATISRAPLFVEDHPGQTVEQICAKIREYSTEKGVRFVIIDYLQIISSSLNAKFQSRTYEIQHMTNQIRIVAKETGVAVLLLSQISRPPKSFETAGQPAPMPQMHDLKDSGAIEQDAYIIMFIGPPTTKIDSMPSWMHPGVEQCTIRIAANRGGCTGDIHMQFHKPYNKFLSFLEFEKYKKKLQTGAK